MKFLNSFQWLAVVAIPGKILATIFVEIVLDDMLDVIRRSKVKKKNENVNDKKRKFMWKNTPVKAAVIWKLVVVEIEFQVYQKLTFLKH